jgi:hypothetical protein
MKNLFVVIVILFIFLASGCIGDEETNSENTILSSDPQEACIELCRQQIMNGVDLSLGPCLSENVNLAWEIDDWACDVAHEPRKDIDNNALNQCQKVRKEEITNFIEVSPNCEFIRKGTTE